VREVRQKRQEKCPPLDSNLPRKTRGNRRFSPRVAQKAARSAPNRPLTLLISNSSSSHGPGFPVTPKSASWPWSVREVVSNERRHNNRI
jgi:hypothetical protein